jgi:uncharacterized SAM-binding protein YcdF (DUF218 family)
VGLALLSIVAFLGIRGIGRWLVVYDPLKPARAIAVLSGAPPFRAMESAKLYHEGWAPEVWLTHPALADELAFRSLGIEYHAEDYYNTQVLEKLGVPASAIRVLPEGILNTAGEELAIATELKKAGGARIIIVTSEPHTRRTRAIWHALVGDAPELIIRGAPEDAYDAGRWWRNTHDAESVSHEVLGLVNVWCGFPARPDRP